MRACVLVVIDFLFIVCVSSAQQEFFPLAMGAKWEYKATFASNVSLPYLPVVEYPEGLLASSMFSGMGSWTAGQTSFELSVGNLVEKTATTTSWKLLSNRPSLKFFFYQTDTVLYTCEYRLKYDGIAWDQCIVANMNLAVPPWRLARRVARISQTELAQRFIISVPAGEFANCVLCTVKISGDSRYVPSGTYPVETYLAPGVGIVKAIGMSPAGSTLYTLELTRFTAGSAVTIKDTRTLPNQMTLHRNYPNPFNPSTTIQFDVASAGVVSLKIYSMLGDELETLVSSTLSPGRYSATWNASNFSSGIYFCRMQSRDFVMTRKLILLK